jgi:hypothetical protein
MLRVPGPSKAHEQVRALQDRHLLLKGVPDKRLVQAQADLRYLHSRYNLEFVHVTVQRLQYLLF